MGKTIENITKNLKKCLVITSLMFNLGSPVYSNFLDEGTKKEYKIHINLGSEKGTCSRNGNSSNFGGGYILGIISTFAGIGLYKLLSKDKDDENNDFHHPGGDI